VVAPASYAASLFLAARHSPRRALMSTMLLARKGFTLIELLIVER